jgi:hypothetical protein
MMNSCMGWEAMVNATLEGAALTAQAQPLHEAQPV